MVGFMPMRWTSALISMIIRFQALLVAWLALPLAGCHAAVSTNLDTSSLPGPALVQEAPRSAYDFVNSIGVNTHLNYFDRLYGNFPLVERELKSIGIRHLRDGVHLQNAAYNATLYARWIQLGDLGIRFDAVLDPRSNLGTLNTALLDTVDSLAGHTIESFEGPNELDVSNMANWPSVDRSYQETIFDSVKSMPDANRISVIGPSLAFASNGSQIGDISDWIDEGNLHPYPAGQLPSIVFPDQINLARAMCGDKPIAFTESGYHNALNDHTGQPGISEEAAAKYIPRLFLEDFAQGVVRTYLYEFMDEGPDPGRVNAQLHWGLIRADGSEKPAFTALKNLIEELNDTSEPERLQPLAWTIGSKDPQIHHLLLQKSDGSFDLILWQEISSYDVKRQVDIQNPAVASVLTLGETARNITVYDPLAQSEPIHTYSGLKSVPLEIPDSPLVVEIAF